MDDLSGRRIEATNERIHLGGFFSSLFTPENNTVIPPFLLDFLVDVAYLWADGLFIYFFFFL